MSGPPVPDPRDARPDPTPTRAESASLPDHARDDTAAGDGDPVQPDTTLPALTDIPPAELPAALADVPGLKPFNARQIRAWVWSKGARDWSGMTDLSKALRAELAARFRVRRGALQRVHDSADGTQGLLSRLDDGRVIESVRIPDGERNTLCISSQVGCAVGCLFCASGLEGVERNLSAGEILEQVLLARELSPEQPLTNYVFMGSGEPTHNLPAVLSAIRTMNAEDGLGIGARRITVSTVGHPAALRKLADEPVPFNVALSVHMPDDEGRQRLMPGLGASDLDATLAAALERFGKTGRRITAEVVVLAGVNDDAPTARAFARRLRGLPVIVNLIPWNPVDGVDLHAPEPESVERVRTVLEQAGITCTVRRPRGQDVGVACGQLRRRAQGGARRGT